VESALFYCSKKEQQQNGDNPMDFNELVKAKKESGMSTTEALLSASQEIVVVKEQELVEVATDIPVHVKRLPINEIVRLVKIDKTKWGIEPESVSSRWLVNYIRHNLTSYDSLIEENLQGRIGREQAYSLLRDRMLEEIGNVYPELRSEVLKQRHSGPNTRTKSSI